MQVFEGCAGRPAPSLMHSRRVMDKRITYVGLDVHKDTIAVALAETGKRGEVREHCKIANTRAALTTLAGKLSHSAAELGTVGNFVCGRAVAHDQASALVKRSPN